MGQAPRNMKETPRQILTAATKPMSTAKPRGPRLRCGVRIASNATVAAWALGAAAGDASNGDGMAPTIQGRARRRQSLLRVGVPALHSADAEAQSRRRRLFSPARRGQSRSARRTRLHQSVYAAGRGGAVGP